MNRLPEADWRRLRDLAPRALDRGRGGLLTNAEIPRFSAGTVAALRERRVLSSDENGDDAPGAATP